MSAIIARTLTVETVLIGAGIVATWYGLVAPIQNRLESAKALVAAQREEIREFQSTRFEQDTLPRERLDSLAEFLRIR